MWLLLFDTEKQKNLINVEKINNIREELPGERYLIEPQRILIDLEQLEILLMNIHQEHCFKREPVNDFNLIKSFNNRISASTIKRRLNQFKKDNPGLFPAQNKKPRKPRKSTKKG